MLTTAAFILFSALLILSAVMVIASRNPVHSVLFLISAFFNAAALFVLLGAEFLAMILVIVYVGAVAVLFLFVVMMLDIDFAELKRGSLQFLPLGLGVGALLAAELILLVSVPWKMPVHAHSVAGSPTPVNVSNTVALGQVIYTDYI